MLSSALRRNGRRRAFQNFQQRLLHAFPGYVSRNGYVFGLLCNFIDFINIDNPMLRTLDIVIRSLNNLQQYILHVFTDIAGFCQCRSVCNGKRHI